MMVSFSIVGFLLDWTGSYVVPFVALGNVVTFGGFLMLISVIIICREKAAQQTHQVEDGELKSGEEAQSLTDHT